MPENYAEILKRIRKDKRITIIELAERMGVSQAYIVKIERGEIEPTQEKMEVIKAFAMGEM